MMGGREEQGGQAELIRGRGTLVKGTGRVAGVDRGLSWESIERQFCRSSAGLPERWML